MSRDAERFAKATSKLRSIESASEREYLHEYKAVLEETDESVRIITLPPHLADDDSATDAFSRASGQWYNANTHPNIVSIIERETTPRPWIALDQPHDLTLDQVRPQLTPAEVQTVVTDTAEALRTLGLYNGVHGALWPGDLLMYPDGDDLTTQIRGFGLENAVRTALEATEPSTYTAPELLNDSNQPTKKTDVYGLGAIAYFALTGRPPVDDPTHEQSIRNGPPKPPSNYNDRISSALDDSIMRALSERPSDRHDSPHAFKRAFLGAFDIDALETLQWVFNTGDEVRSSPAVVDSTVYVGSNDGNVYALSAADGTEQWSYSTDGPVTSSAAVVGNTVYVGSGDANVYGLSAANGTKQWSFQTGDFVNSSPAVADGTVYVGSNDGSVYALSATNGTKQWSYQTADAVRSSPIVVNDTVYVGSNDGNVYALSASRGTKQWAFQTGDHVYSSPAVVDGTVYIGSESKDNTVYALSAADGTQQWNFETECSMLSLPTVVDETVYVGIGDANVYALSAADGTEQWSFNTGRGVLSSPAVTNDTVYVGGGDANVYALSVADGTKQWVFETEDNVLSSPTVANGTVYVGSDDGSVYALSK